MFVFPANDRAYRQRKKAFKACQQCKKGRRRCLPSELDERCKACVEHNLKCSLVTSAQAVSNITNSTREVKVSDLYKGPHDETSTTRFISRLDPSSDLLMMGNVDRDRVGMWVSKATSTPKVDQRTTARRKPVHVPPTLDKHLLQHLNSIHAFEFPQKADRDGLIQLYFDYIHPVLPIINKTCFLGWYEAGDYNAPMLHGMLMVAARHAKATPFLKNTDARNFAVDCYRKLKALLYAGMESGSMNLCRIHALASLHTEGPEGFNESAYNLSCAFHHAYSIGIHLRRNRSDDHPTGAGTDLWWSIWCLDKMSTCIVGGPVKSYTKDVGLQIDECPPSEPQCRRLADVCTMLDEIVELYRPNGDQAIPASVNLVSIPDDQTPFTALVRLMHNMSLLLCYKRNATDDMAGMLISRCLEIFDIVERYPGIVPLPVVPYSVSVTLTVILKFFTLPPANGVWPRACALLDKLADNWWAAEAMASMGRSAFEQLESDASVLKNRFEPQPATAAAAAAAASAAAETPQSVDINELLFENTESFAGQTSMFSEFNPQLVDYWFPTGLSDFTNTNNADLH